MFRDTHLTQLERPQLRQLRRVIGNFAIAGLDYEQLGVLLLGPYITNGYEDLRQSFLLLDSVVGSGHKYILKSEMIQWIRLFFAQPIQGLCIPPQLPLRSLQLLQMTVWRSCWIRLIKMGMGRLASMSFGY